jgi:predicted flap endonuclease-1-like 5' DNA nuclease
MGWQPRARSAIDCLRTVFIVAAIIALVLAALGGYFVGSRRRTPDAAATPVAASSSTPPAQPVVANIATAATEHEFGSEKARITRSLEAEAAALRSRLAGGSEGQLTNELADARAEAARYRQLVIDIENRAPPPILLGAAEPDDLKLIVGIGPVLERMLHNLGVGTFRQIAGWTERDIAEFDAKLPEFPGRIVRDQWVTQARSLHRSKYGDRP